MRWGFVAMVMCGCVGEAGPLDGGADAGEVVDAGGLHALEPAILPLVLSVAPAPGGDVVFAGGLAGPQGGLLARFDGQRIVAVDHPPGPALWWVHAFASGRFAVAGSSGRILAGALDRLEVEPTGQPAEVTLYGVWGVSEADVWAVGGPKGVVLRSSGGRGWRRVDDPAIPADRTLYKVWGRAADDVFVVGEGVALHFDGTRWAAHSFPFAEPLLTVHGRPAGPVLAVGGRTRGIVVRFDGGGWVEEDPGPLPGLSAVFVDADGSALLGGNLGTIVRRAPDGSYAPVPFAPGSHRPDEGFHAIARADGVTWAVGGRLAIGRDGLIATDHPGAAAIDPRGFPVPADGGGIDAGRDAGIDAGRDAAVDAGRDAAVDAGRDAGRDAGIDAGRDAAVDAGRDAADLDAADLDAGDPDATEDVDAGDPDGGLPGPGEDCPAFACQAGLECLPLAPASYMPYCLRTCASPADCADFGEAPCCLQPGPQTFMTYCVPAAVVGGTCP